MKSFTVSVSAQHPSRQGTTLVEVMLSAVILAILAAMASTALFYPRLVVINSGLEQSAVHAGVAEIERNLHKINSVQLGQFNTDGRAIHNTDIISGVRTNPQPELVNGGPETCHYLIITNKISFRTGEPPVELITYRSLEIGSQDR